MPIPLRRKHVKINLYAKINYSKKTAENNAVCPWGLCTCKLIVDASGNHKTSFAVDRHKILSTLYPYNLIQHVHHVQPSCAQYLFSLRRSIWEIKFQKFLGMRCNLYLYVILKLVKIQICILKVTRYRIT